MKLAVGLTTLKLRSTGNTALKLRSEGNLPAKVGWQKETTGIK